MKPLIALCAEGLTGAEAPGDTTGDVVVVPRLCEEPGRLRSLDPAGRPLVLGLCVGRFSHGDVQREARRAGVDPLGIEIVQLDEGLGDARRLAVLIAGAAARATAFRGAHRDQVKLTFPGAVSRRSILTFSLPEYLATPSVEEETCASMGGCRACIDVCPRDAFSLHRGRVVHDRNACEPCGRCVTACPTGAISNPAATPAGIEAQLRALVDPRIGPPGPRGVVFRCRQSSVLESTPGWYPITVPCTSMVTEPWLLAPLVLGASAVAARPCADGGCPLGGDEIVRERVAWCAALLDVAGGAVDRVTIQPDNPPVRSPLPTTSLDDPFGSARPGDVVLALIERAGGATPVVHPGGPVGLVEIDVDACTGCSTCATSCPTGALTTREDAHHTALWFDAGACVACGTCTARCPEVEHGAIDLTRVVDTSRLRGGPGRLWEGEVARCSRCGAPIAAAALLARFAMRLDDERLVAALSERCPDCR